eukprot:CAMPEP_0172916934 /NCGR_PEP_ID=MMETSP1075-20121228/197290_1 /TAXON_ID=2916 /ORGANISM="Ceratium fusus, Strain PA161109" /LENGTH=104 /DNA_ID=CAMNT_0013776317 /DNA_START=32 /DNA_END=347 /DNA_ORIENTATION=-
MMYQNMPLNSMLCPVFLPLRMCLGFFVKEPILPVCMMVDTLSCCTLFKEPDTECFEEAGCAVGAYLWSFVDPCELGADILAVSVQKKEMTEPERMAKAVTASSV